MSIRFPSFLASVLAALVLLLAAAWAENFTPHLDELEAYLRSHADTGPIEDSRVYERAAGWAAGKKKTTSLTADLKRASRAGKKLLRDRVVGKDPVVLDYVHAIPHLFAVDVRLRVEAAQVALDGIADTDKRTAKKKAKIQQRLDRALARVAAAEAHDQEFTKQVMRELASANHDAYVAEKKTAKLDPGPGPDSCPGQPFASGEGAFVTRNGTLIQFTHWEFEPVPQTGHRYFRLYTCDPDMEVELLLRFPQLGSRPIGDKVTEDHFRFRDGFEAVYVGGFEGTCDVTVWDSTTGEVTANFSCTNDAGEVFTGGVLHLEDFYR